MGDSLENMINKPSKLGQVWKAVKRYTVAPLVLATGLYAMGCGGNGNDGDAVNPLPAGYNVSSNITPSDGGSVGPDDSPLEVGVDTPAISDECSADAECSAAAEAGMNVDITATADNGTADTSDDDTQTIVSHTGVPFDSYTSGDLDLDSFHGGAGLSDGETVTLEATLVATDSDGNPYELQGSVSVVYEEGATGPRVTGCYVNHSQVGGSIGISCHCSEPAESFSLTGGPESARIFNDGGIGTTRGMEASDVGLHTYNVTCTAGGVTSPDYEFTVPVDEHGSRLVIHCAEGGEERMLLPETSVDAVATACGDGFNPALKPDTVGDPDYILDVDHTCVQGAIDGLTPAEQEAHQNYNEGVTVEDVYSDPGCTVDFAQVVYNHG